jgi:tetratricopeptide (TPR) repeat protein
MAYPAPPGNDTASWSRSPVGRRARCATRGSLSSYPAPIDSRVRGKDGAGGPARPDAGPAAEPRTLADLARVLRGLRRRLARQQGGPELTYRELAAMTGWSHGIIGEYLTGRVLPPTDRFDVLVRLLGAGPAEQGALATARDRVEESRRRTPPGGALTGALVPRQLPVDVFGFTGRASQLADLDALLEHGLPGHGPPAHGAIRPAALISAVAGTAGVGKTALAVRWAHRVAGRFPDGQLYIDLRGYDPERPVAPAEALARFLRSLGMDGAKIPGETAERAACYRTMLAGRRMLVVLDNAHAADQVRPLLPGTPSCFVLVTSRDDLTGLVARDGARRIELDMLTAAEAVTLLRTLIGPRVDADVTAANALAERCLRLPLALRIAAELATAHPDMTPADLLADLHDEQRRLDLLNAAGDPRTAIRSVFSWSCQHLTGDAARGFALLGLHPGPDIDTYAMAALAGSELRQARALVAELARAHLIERAGPGRYTMHDLLRAYAIERVTTSVRAAARHAAVSRLFGYYSGTAAAAMNTLFPHERRSRPDVRPPRTPAPPVGERAGAAAWLDQQRPSLVAIAVYAASHGWPRHSIDLSCTLWRAFEVGGHYQEALAVHTSAAEAALKHGRGRASVLANLGSIHWWLGNHREAQTYFEQSLAGHRQAGEAEGEARALARLGLVRERLGRYGEAVAHMRDALAIYRRTGNRYGEGAQLVNLGSLHRRLGRYATAAEHHQQAATVFAEICDPRLEGYALGNLGAVCSLLGRHAEALTYLGTALANCRQAGDRGGEGSALAAIGAVYQRQERYPQALGNLHHALAISRETGDRSLETETLNTLGDTLRAMRQPESALARHRAALDLTENTHDRFEQARALDGIAQVLDDTGQPTQAHQYWREALAIYSALGVPEAEQARAHLNG